MYVLVDEANQGRYPSIQKRPASAEPNSEVCLACKKVRASPVLPCDFCNASVHWEGLRKRFVLKKPEPVDDFMWHKCIQYVLARRARAEKRRQDRQAKEELSLKPTSLDEKIAKVKDLAMLLEDAKKRLQDCTERAKTNQLRQSRLP